MTTVTPIKVKIAADASDIPMESLVRMLDALKRVIVALQGELGVNGSFSLTGLQRGSTNLVVSSEHPSWTAVAYSFDEAAITGARGRSEGVRRQMRNLLRVTKDLGLGVPSSVAKRGKRPSARKFADVADDPDLTPEELPAYTDEVYGTVVTLAKASEGATLTIQPIAGDRIGVHCRLSQIDELRPHFLKSVRVTFLRSGAACELREIEPWEGADIVAELESASEDLRQAGVTFDFSEWERRRGL